MELDRVGRLASAVVRLCYVGRDTSAPRERGFYITAVKMQFCHCCTISGGGTGGSAPFIDKYYRRDGR